MCWFSIKVFLNLVIWWTVSPCSSTLFQPFQIQRLSALPVFFLGLPTKHIQQEPYQPPYCKQLQHSFTKTYQYRMLFGFISHARPSTWTSYLSNSIFARSGSIHTESFPREMPSRPHTGNFSAEGYGRESIPFCSNIVFSMEKHGKTWEGALLAQQYKTTKWLNTEWENYLLGCLLLLQEWPLTHSKPILLTS